MFDITIEFLLLNIYLVFKNWNTLWSIDMLYTLFIYDSYDKANTLFWKANQSDK